MEEEKIIPKRILIYIPIVVITLVILFSIKKTNVDKRRDTENIVEQEINFPPTKEVEYTPEENVWKSYNNKDKKIDFKYPSEAVILIDETEEDAINIEYNDNNCSKTNELDCSWFVRIYGPYEKESASIEDFIKKIMALTETPETSYILQKEDSIFNFTATKINFLDTQENEYKTDRYFFTNNNSVFELIVGIYNGQIEGQSTDYEKTVLEVLKSINLTN